MRNHRSLAAKAGIAVLVFYTLLAIEHYALRSRREPSLPFAGSLEAEQLEASLKWYAEHALGALRPVKVLTLPVDEATHEPLERDTLVSQGVFLDTGETLTLPAPEHRASIWWAGLPHRPAWHYSPFLYEIGAVEAVEKSTDPGRDYARVKFSWRIKDLTPLYRALAAAELAPAEAQLKEQLQLPALPGKWMHHEVLFHQSKYGSFLVLTREPSYSTH